MLSLYEKQNLSSGSRMERSSEEVARVTSHFAEEEREFLIAAGVDKMKASANEKWLSVSLKASSSMKM